MLFFRILLSEYKTMSKAFRPRMIETDIAETMNSYHVFLLERKNPSNPIYYLPHDMVETILKEMLTGYIEMTQTLFNNPTKVVRDDDDGVIIYTWKVDNKLHRTDDLPAEITIDIEKRFIKILSWFTKGRNIRSDNKPCMIQYDSYGNISSKTWDDGSENAYRTTRHLPLSMVYNRQTDKVMCQFGPGIPREYYSSDSVPKEYGWNKVNLNIISE